MKSYSKKYPLNHVYNINHEKLNENIGGFVNSKIEYIALQITLKHACRVNVID